MKKIILIVLAAVLPALSVTSAQTNPDVLRYRKDQRGTISERKESILQTNRIRTLFQNNGEIGHWPYSPSLEWPKGSGVDNLDGFSILVAAEVKLADGSTIHPLETSYREWMDKSPLTGEVFGLEPVPGYSNPLSTSPAKASDPQTWPEKWPDALGIPLLENNSQWYGFFGMKTVDNLEETFFVLDDSKDGEWKRPPYNYYPISTDSSFGGLGLRIETRALQSANTLAENAVFWNYDIINIADSAYTKSYVGFYVDTGSGGSNSGPDNAYYKINDLVYCWDDKGSLADGKKVGYQGFTALESAGSGISALSLYVQGDGGVGGGWPKDDESMWLKMSSAKYDVSVQQKNISMVFASGPYSLIPGKKLRYTMAIIAAWNLEDLLREKENIQSIYNSGYQYLITNDFPVRSSAKITYPVKGSVLSETAEVRWTLPDLYPKATAYFEITNDNRVYNPLGEDKTQSGKITFSTQEMKDGIFYRIRAFIYNDYGSLIDYIYSDYFTINNIGNAAPEVRIIYPKENSTVLNKQLVTWTAGDADNDPFNISILYRTSPSSNWVTVAEGISRTDTSYQWNSENFANSETGVLMLKASSLSDISAGYSEVKSLQVRNSRTVFNGGQYVVNRKTKGTGKISISKVNPLEITGHDYSVTFDSLNNTGLVYNVKDITTGKQVLVNQTDMDGKAESGYFDGLRLIVKADTVEVIDSLSGLRSAKSNFAMPIAVNSNKQYGIRLPYDYELDFTGAKNIPSFDGNQPPDGPRVNFIARNITRGDTVRVLLNDKNGDNVLNPGEDFTIVEFVDKNGNGTYELSERRYNWQISYQMLDAVPAEPVAGDKFFLTVGKPFIKGDQITFSTKKLTSVSAGKPVPEGFYLSQNYPNPFNPSTTIGYGLSRQSFVELSVYDLLGKKIMTLVNKIQSAGSYQVRFDGSSLPSGLYIYKIKAGGFVDSKKLMLVK